MVKGNEKNKILCVSENKCKNLFKKGKKPKVDIIILIRLFLFYEKISDINIYLNFKLDNKFFKIFLAF